MNSTLKAAGKMDKGIIQIPGGCFRIGVQKPSARQKNRVRKEKEQPKPVDSYDYCFDKMPI